MTGKMTAQLNSIDLTCDSSKLALADQMDVRYATAGPLYSAFPSPEARVLDQALLVGNMKQTIGMLAESTALHEKTVEKVVREFVAKGWMKEEGDLEGEVAFCFNASNHLHELIDWAMHYQFSER